MKHWSRSLADAHYTSKRQSQNSTLVQSFIFPELSAVRNQQAINSDEVGSDPTYIQNTSMSCMTWQTFRVNRFNLGLFRSTVACEIRFPFRILAPLKIRSPYHSSYHKKIKRPQWRQGSRRTNTPSFQGKIHVT
jgi:hypothetical protein